MRRTTRAHEEPDAVEYETAYTESAPLWCRKSVPHSLICLDRGGARELHKAESNWITRPGVALARGDERSSTAERMPCGPPNVGHCVRIFTTLRLPTTRR